MGRAPCCEKMGLKKGPWTREEDHILINYINLYGHGNWRALPKQAGLLRCGKSCRLRWTNYLRPDIKRGNFSEEEEDTIIKLHGVLGNRWSTIAARLPGRTDNEIKNVWHTHLKKRLNQIQVITPDPEQNSIEISKFEQDIEEDKPNPVNFITQTTFEGLDYRSNSPQYSSSDMSSATTTVSDNNNSGMMADPLDNFPKVNENFWSDIFEVENSDVTSNFPVVDGLFSPLHSMEYVHGNNSSLHDGTDFWCALFTRGWELLDMPEF